MSPRVRHICYFLDYGALSLYSLGEPHGGGGQGEGSFRQGGGVAWGSWGGASVYPPPPPPPPPQPQAPTPCRPPGCTATCTSSLCPPPHSILSCVPASPATPGGFLASGEGEGGGTEQGTHKHLDTQDRWVCLRPTAPEQN